MALIAASSLSAFAFAVACGGGDNNAGGDDSSTDSGTGTDVTVPTDSGPPADSGPGDSGGPFCNVSPCAVSVGVGGVHSCAILSDNTIRCWGGSSFGALGNGAPVDGGPQMSATPLAVTGISTAAKVAGGGYFAGDIGYTCATLKNKTLDCWGFSGFGELGQGDAASPSSATPASTLLSSAIDVSASLYSVCAVLASGDVTCWGINVAGQIAPPASDSIYPSPTVLTVSGARFTHVSVGVVNACAITDDGHVWCWGDPEEGANGHYSDGGTQDQPAAPVGGVDSVVDIATGYVGGCAVKSDGSVVCWGGNVGGELGRGNLDGGPAFDVAPATVSTPAGKKFTNVVAHIEGYCALADDNTVWCWGLNIFGANGSGVLDSGNVYPSQYFAATQVDGLTDVIAISSSSYGGHTCALIRGGAVKCWGLNQIDQLGYANPDGGAPLSITPVTVNF